MITIAPIIRQNLPSLTAGIRPPSPAQLPLPPLVSTVPSGNLSYTGVVREDVVAVFDSSYNQVFQLARSMKLNVLPSSKLMDHPIENGATRSDFRVFNPTDLELSVVCTSDNYQAVYQQIKTAYLSGDVFFVTSKADTYSNMMIQAIPHDEIPDMFDVITVAIKMREVILVQTQYQPLPAAQVRDVNDQSTVNTGATTPRPGPSLLANAFPKLFTN